MNFRIVLEPLVVTVGEPVVTPEYSAVGTEMMTTPDPPEPVTLLEPPPPPPPVFAAPDVGFEMVKLPPVPPPPVPPAPPGWPLVVDAPPPPA